MLPATTIEAWHHRLGAAIGRLGSPQFGLALDHALAALAPFDLTCALAYPSGAPPVLLHDGLRGHGSPEAMANYLKGTYVLDAVYFACTNGVVPGLYRLRELAPDAFFVSDYYNSWEVHPCISMASGILAEEIAYIAKPLAGGAVILSLMRANGNRPFAEDEFARLKVVEPTVGALLLAQWERDATVAASPALRPGIEQAFDSFAADRLSARERMVVSLILRGHSSLSAANRLGIAEGTVKNHRKSIYAKLGISSQSELFARFTRHVLDG